MTAAATTRHTPAGKPSPTGPDGGGAAPASPYAVTGARVLRAEWFKLRSLRSSRVTAATAVLLVIAVALLMGGTYESGGGDSDVDPVVLVLQGTMLSQICFAVLGILVTAGEYATGSIRATLTAVPARLPVLWAKAAVFTATVFTLGLATALVSYPAAQVLLADTDQAGSLTDDGVLAALAGNSAGVTLVALIALGLGALLRSVPGALGAFVGGVVIVPEILGALPYEAAETAVRYFPTQAAHALGSSTPLPGAASPGAALLALLLWAGGTLALAAVLLKRRDV
ncbi:ABC transporter permease [Streptomyces sudanensis]|uniref:ABC transporter permease n=1 Tax=Streptomyces sudanensis TaxID=436397 RepID=UPI0020CE46EA|nr:ABC transporter permease [Streptomyces sudanensis]MCP9987465.1 ABC transporter permease [Streptomyces sudanensis]